MAVHVGEELREGVRRHQVPRGEPRAVLERERRGVELHRIDEEPPLDVEPRLPRALALELPAQNLEQHLGEPVLARVEDWEQDVRKRPAAVRDERRAAAGAAVGERIGDRKSTRLNSSHTVISYA